MMFPEIIWKLKFLARPLERNIARAIFNSKRKNINTVLSNYLGSDNQIINSENHTILFQTIPNEELHDENLPSRELKILFQNSNERLDEIPKPDLQDHLLFRKILELDETTLRKIYDSEFPVIDDMIYRNYGYTIDSRDVFQSAMIILVERIHQGKFRFESTIRTFLYSVSKNICKNESRTASRRRGLLNDYLINRYDFTNMLDTTEEIYQIENEINKLGDPCKKLLEYYYYRNLDWQQIANKLGYRNAASAKTQKYKCIKSIKHNISALKA